MAIEFFIDASQKAYKVLFYEENTDQVTLELVRGPLFLDLRHEPFFVDVLLETFFCEPAELLVHGIDENMNYRVRIYPVGYPAIKGLILRLADLNFECTQDLGGTYSRIWAKAVEWEKLR